MGACIWLPEAKYLADTSEAQTLPDRPNTAFGTFLRIITVNDVHTLDNLPRVAAAVDAARASATQLNCVVTSHCNGDFISPGVFTALDGGITMIEGMNRAKIDYFCLGNHEFDVGFSTLEKRLAKLKGKVINSNCEDEEVSHLPKYDMLKVGKRTVVVAGLLTGDKSVYTLPVPTVSPVADACIRVWRHARDNWKTCQASHALAVPDAFLPMTHQSIPNDQATARAISQHPELAPRTPCILGGHDHDPFMEKTGNTMIVKVGQDANNIGIVDIWWKVDGTLQCRSEMLAAKAFPEEPEAKQFVKKKEALLESLMRTPIAEFAQPVSSKRVRFESSGVATFIMDLVKRGLKDHGVEIALINAGNIRGDKDYSPGPFTMGDLFTENPWENEMAIVKLPGKVIADAVCASRSGEGQKPSFLHADYGAHITETHILEKVNDQALLPDKMYVVAILIHLLTGMDKIPPLLDYVAQAGLKIPDTETCKPSKDIVLKCCMRDAWKKILGMEMEDPRSPNRQSHWTNRKDLLSQEKLDEAVTAILDKMDCNKNGAVLKQQVCEFLRSHKAPVDLLEQMFDALDTNGDGRIQRSEVEDLIC